MANYKVSITLDAQDKASPAFKELNKQLDQTKRGAADINQSSGGLLDRFGGLTGVVTAAAGAFAALQLGQKILELRDLGAAATAAGNTFEQLSGGAIAARANLDAMRAATRGVVDDTTLMGGANRLLLMNLASTGEEAAKLTGIAVALGRAMGQDAGTAVADFASLLANQSIPRLDNFGISSANVRARIEELTTGVGALSREAAFTQAVLEEGTTSMDRLGSSIDANASQWDRLMTRVSNGIASVGEAVFSVGEGIAGAVNGAIGELDTLIARLNEVEANRQIQIDIVTNAATDATQGAVDAVLAGVEEGVRDTYAEMAGLTSEQMAPLMEGIRYMIEGGVIASDLSPDEQIRQYEYLTGQVIAGPQRQVIADTLQSYMETVTLQAAQQAMQANQWGPVVGRITEAGTWTGGPGTDADLLRGAQQYQTAMAERQAEAARRQIERERASLWALRSMQQTYASMDQMGLAAGFDSTPWQERQMQQAQIEQRNVRQYSENMWESYATVRENQQRQAAGEWAAQGILDLWGGLTERGTQIASAFQNAAESARTIQSKLGEAGDKLATSLSSVLNLGVTGGFQGDVYSQIAALIDDEEARQQFELGTGLSTTGQRAFSEVAGIIAGMSGDQQVSTAQAFAAFMQSGMFRPDMTTADIMSQLGYVRKPGGQQFQVFAGDTYADIQARTGLNAQQVMNAAGITDSRYLLPGMYSAGDEYTQFTMGRNMGDKGGGENVNPMRVLAEDAQKANDEIAQVQTALDEINGTTASVKIKLEADDSALPAVLRELMRFGSLAQAFEGVANKNGGTVPGNNVRSQARYGTGAKMNQ